MVYDTFLQGLVADNLICILSIQLYMKHVDISDENKPKYDQVSSTGWMTVSCSSQDFLDTWTLHLDHHCQMEIEQESTFQIDFMTFK